MRNFITGLIFLILLMLGIPAFASGPRILFIGDSHVSGIFGITLDSLLTQIPDAQIATYGSCGTIGASWMNHGKTTCGSFAHIHASGQPETRAKSPLHASTPQLVDLLKDFHPTHLIVELGANYGPKIVDAGGSTKNTEADLKKFVQIIRESGVKCFWVSMPDSWKLRAQETSILETTRAAIDGVCEFYDSTQITHYPANVKDGIHYETGNGLAPMAKAWAQDVFLEFLNYFL